MERVVFNRVHGWLWQRITSVILFIGLVVHFGVAHFLVERPITFAKVTERLNHPLWIVFDIILLFCAIYHGLNGVWNIFVDYKSPKIVRGVFGWMLVVMGFGMFIFGAYILTPFRDF